MAIFKTQGVCATDIIFQVENGTVKQLEFIGGCPGNLAAIAKLVQGMPVADVISKLRGIQCGESDTSCVDQLAIALSEFEKK
ncbi:hypothetical protein AXX12_14510 [Anaerosporomusa subterranea]|jgi:uncharacterized protein (TIGR03905 family)|uniref:ribonucleoside-diphosphate reductase n=1 Tax=Anaerosporomusa subterranea TaxID=1794912 RepID=A0A154BN84_ANASB|nr:TIGR03905 family TSCPD domain-containing protein [Anaerosporomusa subterranea]KYZ75361.1 hypothetical protein AXX12_14510 [Anaerosporomusa subterranea]MDF2500226.1 uncharacterized protein [Anaerosporomusa subterranea]